MLVLQRVVMSSVAYMVGFVIMVFMSSGAQIMQDIHDKIVVFSFQVCNVWRCSPTWLRRSTLCSKWSKYCILKPTYNRLFATNWTMFSILDIGYCIVAAKNLACWVSSSFCVFSILIGICSLSVLSISQELQICVLKPKGVCKTPLA